MIFASHSGIEQSHKGVFVKVKVMQQDNLWAKNLFKKDSEKVKKLINECGINLI